MFAPRVGREKNMDVVKQNWAMDDTDLSVAERQVFV